jgi:hypothetical protein
MLLKSMVLSLVLANAAYFLWARGVGAPVAPGAPVAGTGTLKLAAEVPELARYKGAEQGGSGPTTAAAGGNTAANTALTPAAGVGAEARGSGAAGSETHQTLLNNVKRCITVGPFRDVSEAAHAASTLRGGGYDPRQRVAEGDVWSGVWVYVPLPAPRGAGEQILAKLKAGGIDDAMEMPGPNEGPVISLGLYVEPKRAQARVAQAQALGFNPGISDRKRTGNVYWIDIDLKPTDGLLNPQDLQGESGRIVRLEVKSCPLGSAT